MASRADVAYAAAKAGTVGLTRALAVDEAPHGVTVNAVARRHVPVGRSRTPEEVASAIVWLASTGASYITGQVIIIDGGNSISQDR